MLILAKKKSQLHCTTTAAVSPNHWKQHWRNNDGIQQEHKNDVSGSSIVPNHWKHWMTAFQQDVTFVSHSDGDHISRTTYHNDNMKCPTTLTTIICQVPGINTRYQEGKKTGKEKKKRKMTPKQTSMRSGSRRVRRGRGRCLLVIRSVPWCV